MAMAPHGAKRGGGDALERLDVFRDEREDGDADDEEVEDVPRLAQVGLGLAVLVLVLGVDEAEDNDLEAHLNREEDGEEDVEHLEHLAQR